MDKYPDICGPIFIGSFGRDYKDPYVRSCLLRDSMVLEANVQLRLAFLVFVTFETMFNGLERNFASLKYSMDVKMDKYTLLKEQSANLEVERKLAEELTLDSIEEAYNARLNAIYTDFDKNIVAIDERYESQFQASSDEFIEEKRADKERLNEALSSLRAAYRRTSSGIKPSDSDGCSGSTIS